MNWPKPEGVMQLMPATARAMGVPEGKEQNPEESVKAAVKYIGATARSFSITKFFVDDGFSGVSFEREGLQAMLQDVYKRQLPHRTGGQRR